MPTLRLQTDLRCGACVESVRPLLDAAPTVRRWDADTDSPDKVVTVEGDLAAADVDALLRQKGYRVLRELPAPLSLTMAAPPPAASAAEPPTSYYPLVLILLYLVGVVGLVEWLHGTFAPMRAMAHFMAGFFLVFSFFKLLDVSAFATSYRMYDLLAERVPAWGYAYPFVELALGVAYLTHFAPTLTNVMTLAVMLLGTAGVARTLVQRKKVRCACLGSVFNLPMSTVTLTEDLLMAGMAAAMLVM